VLTITKNLRQVGVVGKFVEFYGPGVACLSIADRATISNMCPEFGGTVGYFAVDDNAIEYLRQTSEWDRTLKDLQAKFNGSNDFRSKPRKNQHCRAIPESNQAVSILQR
jgi:aconitate hydratase